MFTDHHEPIWVDMTCHDKNIPGDEFDNKARRKDRQRLQINVQRLIQHLLCLIDHMHILMFPLQGEILCVLFILLVLMRN